VPAEGDGAGGHQRRVEVQQQAGETGRDAGEGGEEQRRLDRVADRAHRQQPHAKRPRQPQAPPGHRGQGDQQRGGDAEAEHEHAGHVETVGVRLLAEDGQAAEPRRRGQAQQQP
jgi:hypothetical protein